MAEAKRCDECVYSMRRRVLVEAGAPGTLWRKASEPEYGERLLCCLKPARRQVREDHWCGQWVNR